MIEVPKLEYGYDALEPYIDTRTMEIHLTRHHAGYISKLNKLFEGHESLAAMDLKFVLSDLSIVPEEIREGVRNSGGGHLNHSLFWEIMGPAEKGGEPTGKFQEDIVATFGTFSSFQEEFTKVALGRFGSGWGWLVLDQSGNLTVLSTPNQDSTFMLGSTPILGIDVWEHAYYLTYQNHREEYIKAWWNVVNWERVAELYTRSLEAVAKTAR